MPGLQNNKTHNPELVEGLNILDVLGRRYINYNLRPFGRLPSSAPAERSNYSHPPSYASATDGKHTLVNGC